MLKHKYAFEALGTSWVIETDQPISVALKEIIQEAIEAFDITYSRFRQDSLVTKLSQQAGSYEFPASAIPLFSFYEQLYVITGSKVTPLIGDMISRAGYDADYSFEPKEQKPISTWDVAVRREGRVLHVSQPIILDVGAAGKGYLVDCVAQILDEHEAGEYVIDASGDMRHKGKSENLVGLEHPLDHGKVIGAIEVQNASLCASATNRRVWGEGLHHIFDPDTMAPVGTYVATWVLAKDTMVADGLATALFFVDPSTLANHYSFEYVRMGADGSVEYSPLFNGKLFV
ncbi:MAG: FAD:protein FMN transferase [Candidatus Microsaccharimonas sp.]